MMAVALVGAFAGAAPWFGVLLAGTQIGLHGRILYEVRAPYVFFALTVIYAGALMSRLKNVAIVVSAMHVGKDERGSRSGK